MKYLVFAGEQYYPGGGSADFVHGFEADSDGEAAMVARDQTRDLGTAFETRIDQAER